jgi:bifunctional non-homologous end joining protein LigD
MLWDRGTWTPESEDVDRALAKGDLKFTLDGYKLKGSWVLVRTRGYGGNRRGGESGKTSWLLIKHRDDWSGDLDIAEFAPRSVKSDGDFADILAEDNPAIWHTNRPAKGGDTGEAFEKIIARAVEIKAARTGGAAQEKKEKSADAPKKKAASKPSTPKRKSAANKK